MRFSPIPTLALGGIFLLTEDIADGFPASGPSTIPLPASNGFVSVKDGKLYSQGGLWNFAYFNSAHLLGAAPFEVRAISAYQPYLRPKLAVA